MADSVDNAIHANGARHVYVRRPSKMLKYTGELYAKIGRKYIPTGKTGADWDDLERRALGTTPSRPEVGSCVKFDWDGEKRTGVVTTYHQCADGCFEVVCDQKWGNEVLVLRSDMVRVLPNDSLGKPPA